MRKEHPERRVIYESANLRVIYQPADSHILALSFNGGLFNGSGMEFFGSSFLSKQGFAAVGFVDRHSGWFPPEDMNLAISAVDAEVPRTPAANAITFGISMGAWAALKYSRPLRAHAALAFGPQFSIDPSLVGRFDCRFHSLFRPTIHSGMRICQTDLCDRNFVFFDPLAREDAGHAELIGELAGVQRVPGPFLGHCQYPYWTEMRLVSSVFALANHSNPSARNFRALVRSRRAESSRYHLARAEFLRSKGRGWTNLALRSYRDAVHLNRLPPDHKEVFRPIIGLVNALLDADRMEEAEAQAERLLDHIDTITYSPELRDLLLRMRAHGQVQKLVTKAIAKDPRDPELRIDLARMMLLSSDSRRARAELDVACQYADERPTTLPRIAALYTRMGYLQEAAEAVRSNQDRQRLPDSAPSSP